MTMSADPVAVDTALANRWPDAACELLATDPWEVTVAAILSARTTDTQVNKVMATLGEHLVGIEAYARLEPAALQALIRRLPLHGQKARAIVEAARAIITIIRATFPTIMPSLWPCRDWGAKPPPWSPAMRLACPPSQPMCMCAAQSCVWAGPRASNRVRPKTR